MPRFPIDSSNITEGKIIISGSDHKHITRVLRSDLDDVLTLFTREREYKARIEEINSKMVVLEIIESTEVNRESPLRIHLFQGVLKSAKMDFIIQKCTELGVISVTPVVYERSQINKTNKLKRWTRISEESCKQCGRNIPLQINKLESLESILNERSLHGENILFDINSENNFKNYLDSLKDTPKSVNVFIGPEGGYTRREANLLKSRDILPLRFGPRILRSETAAISAVTLIQFLFGDLQS